MSGDPAPQQCARCAAKVAWGTIAVNGILGVFKMGAGALTESAAISVDGIQSLACAIVGCFVAAGMKIGRRPADARFPHGYGKAEFLVSILSYSGLLGLGVFMLGSSTYLLLAGRSSPPMLFALPVAVISIVANYLMFAACRCAGNAISSAGLLANAGQNHADMLSSCSVALSVVLCQIGPSFYFFDALAAIIAAAVIIVEAASCWWDDMQVLLDRAANPAVLARARATALAVDGVEAIRFARGRRLGAGESLEIGVILQATRSVEEAQRICAGVRQEVMCRMAAVQSALVLPYADTPAGEDRGAGPRPADRT